MLETCNIPIIEHKNFPKNLKLRDDFLNTQNLLP